MNLVNGREFSYGNARPSYTPTHIGHFYYFPSTTITTTTTTTTTFLLFSFHHH